MLISHRWDGYYRASIGGLRAETNWLRGQRLWVQGCRYATMEVERCKIGAVNERKMMQE